MKTSFKTFAGGAFIGAVLILKPVMFGETASVGNQLCGGAFNAKHSVESSGSVTGKECWKTGAGGTTGDASPPSTSATPDVAERQVTPTTAAPTGPQVETGPDGPQLVIRYPLAPKT